MVPTGKRRVMKVNGGEQTRLWKDVWVGECPLKIEFESLYRCCSKPDITVKDAKR